MQNDLDNSVFFLKKYWNHDSFRPLQSDIILSAIQKHDTLALLPTGGGKSICFQIPGLVLGGTCLVISPLIALMNDQVHNLKQKGISAVAITSSMSFREIEIALNNAALGHVQFMYVSPERIENEIFRQKLSYLPINLIAVDEAHCISQWGYDFRPSYLKIAELRQYFPKVNIIALTASATNEVVKDIQDKLGFTKQQVFKQSFERKNIRYVVQFEENKYSRLLKIIQNIGGSGIVYVRNRKKTEEISKWLTQNNVSSNFYHAGIEANLRQTIQTDWIENRKQVIVATNAFGMGIDKPNVRFVVHLDLPESLEAYFQEAGRAGRDGNPAYSVVLVENYDTDNLLKQFEDKTPTVEEIKQCYLALCNYFQIAVNSGEGTSFEFDINIVCNNYNIKPIVMFNTIKCLEKEGYFSYIDTGFEPPKVLMVMQKTDIYNFELKHPKHEPLIKVLLRSYGGIFENYALIKEKDLAYRAKISEDELLKQLNYLNQQGVINYIPQTTLPKINFLQNRLNLKQSNIQLAYYPVLKEKTLHRIQSVIRYVNENAICRSRQLLHYFNETNYQDCHYCDVCLSNKTNEFETSDIINEILEVIKNNSISLTELVKVLGNHNSKTVTQVINQLLDEDVLKIDEHKILSIIN